MVQWVYILNHVAHYGLQVLEHLEQHLRCVRHATNKFEDEFVEGKARSKCLGTDVSKQVGGTPE